MGDVISHGLFRHAEVRRDLGIVQALRDALEDLGLARREAVAGIRLARMRPSSNGARRSPRAWRIKVGQRTRGADFVTSIMKKLRISLTAFAGEQDLRCSSLRELSCARVAPGMNCVENICR